MPIDSLRSFRVRAIVTLLGAVALLATPRLAPIGVRAQEQEMSLAYIVQTITLRGPTVRTELRQRPERVSPASSVTAITRIEVPAGVAASLTDDQLEQVAFAVADTADLPGVQEVQVDFDVTISQRCFYRALVHRIRELLPADTRFSITALASWCMDDDWLSDLPIDEAVPMLRTGDEWKIAAARAAEEGRPLEGPCRNALALGVGK